MKEDNITWQDKLIKIVTNDSLNNGGPQDAQSMISKINAIKNHPYTVSQGSDGFWRTYLPQGEHGRKQIKKRNRDDVIRAIQEYQNQVSLKLSIIYDQAIAHSREKGRKESTIEQYRKVWKKFISDFSDVPITLITSDTFYSWFESWKKKHGKISDSEFKKIRDTIRAIFAYCESKQIISWDYTIAIRKVNNDKDLFIKKVRKTPYNPNSTDAIQKYIFLPEEVSQIKDYCRNNLDKINMAILLDFATGLRAGELVAIQRDCVSLGEEALIHVLRSETTYSNEFGHVETHIQDDVKTRQAARSAIVNNDCIDILQKLCDGLSDSEFLFQGITVKKLTDRLVAICKKLNIPRRSSNKIRKTVATEYWINRVEERDILAQFGHTKIETTLEHYIQGQTNAVDRSRRINDLLHPHENE